MAGQRPRDFDHAHEVRDVEVVPRWDSRGFDVVTRSTPAERAAQREREAGWAAAARERERAAEARRAADIAAGRLVPTPFPVPGNVYDTPERIARNERGTRLTHAFCARKPARTCAWPGHPWAARHATWLAYWTSWAHPFDPEPTAEEIEATRLDTIRFLSANGFPVDYLLAERT